MDLLSLRYFQVVARCEHMSRAAEELHVAQPSVSRTIARLEAEVGVRLFDRRGRRIGLNRHGAAFLRRVDRALAELEDGRRELADAARGGGGGTVVVASETLLTLTRLLAGFRAAHPGVDVRLRQSSADSMARELRTREVDFCLASQPLAGPALTSTVLLTEPVLLAVPPGHRLAGRHGVAMTDLIGEPFVTPGPGHWQRVLADRLFVDAGVRPRVVCEGDEPGAVLDLVAAGVGVALVPSIARAFGTRDIVGWARLDSPEARRQLCLVRAEGAYESPDARSFADFAVRHFSAPSGPARQDHDTAPHPGTP